MSLQEIEAAIELLPPQDVTQLRAWLDARDMAQPQFENDAWDEQIERDVSAGKLNALAEHAKAQFAAGRCREL